MGKQINLKGMQFGFWTVIDIAERPKTNKQINQTWWLCRCKCGKESVRKGAQLLYAERKGRFQSCQSCAAIRSGTQHGLSKIPEYKVWISMVERCTNPSHRAFHNYGGRGITVSKDWLDFEAFLKDMGKKPYKDASLDRIDNNKGYSKENCRWTDWNTQAINRRGVVLLTYKGRTQTLSQWARETGLSAELIHNRIQIHGYTVEQALTKPVYGKRFNQRCDAIKYTFNGETHSLKEWAEIKGVKKSLIETRLKRGWSIDRAIGDPVHGKS